MRERGTTVTPLTEEQIDGLIADYQAGMKVKDIALKYSVNRWTIRQHLIRHQVPTRARGMDPTLVSEAVALYQSGLTLAEVGRQLNSEPSTVRNRLREAGIELRPAARRARSIRPQRRAS